MTECTCRACYGTGYKGGYERRQWRIRACRACAGRGVKEYARVLKTDWPRSQPRPHY